MKEPPLFEDIDTLNAVAAVDPAVSAELAKRIDPNRVDRVVARTMRALIKKRPADQDREPYSVEGLGKYPVIIAVGDPLTREQTNEVMLRTNYWNSVSSNEEAWNDRVAYILGVADKLNESLKEFPGGYTDWDYFYKLDLMAQFADGINALKLFALDNQAINSTRFGAARSWLNWSGQIRARYTEGSKWTSTAEVESDWRDIAAAFPFLRLRAQLVAGTYLNDLPPGTVGAEWVVENGTVTRVEHPGKPLIGPERWWQKHHEDWYEFFWWRWKIATPITAIYYWQRRRHRRRWPHIGPWSLEMHWSERSVSAARLIEAVDQMKESVMPDTFTVTSQHLKLLERLNLRWEDSYRGAPGADPKMPYGSKWVFHDIAEILDPAGVAAIPDGDDAALGRYEQEHEEEFFRIHEGTFKALDIGLRTGQFKAGTYRRTDPWAHDWKLVEPSEEAV